MEEDTKEMKRWRSLNQSEMDLRWKSLAEKISEEVLDKHKVEATTRDIKSESGEKIAGINFLLVFRGYNLQRLQSKQEESTEEEEMKQQQRMTIMKDLKKKIKSKGRMDAQNRWLVSELLAMDCEKTWIHTGWENAVQKWYEWLEHMKKEDEKEKWRRCISERWRR